MDKVDRFLTLTPVKGLMIPQDRTFKEANIVVSEELKRQSAKCKHGKEANHVYTDKITTKIVRYTAENGNTRTIRKSSQELDWMISESTIKDFKKSSLAKVHGGLIHRH